MGGATGGLDMSVHSHCLESVGHQPASAYTCVGKLHSASRKNTGVAMCCSMPDATI
jgi:hypothetical protein